VADGGVSASVERAVGRPEAAGGHREGGRLQQGADL